MLSGNKDKKKKYSRLQLSDEEDCEKNTTDFEFGSMKSKVCSPSCVWTSFFTSALIGTYYIPSIGLTFYQRWLYQNFHFPLLTVVVHMTVKYLLATLIRVILIKKQKKPRVVTNWRDYVFSVAPTGIFSGIDIGFSNWGLELITVSLYTMTKSTTIVFILFFSILFKLEKKSWSLCVIVTMITIGLILFTYKSTQFNIVGFVLLLVASISSGLRWTCMQLLLQKSKMGMSNPVDMIYHMQPWMIASVLPFAIYNEGYNLAVSCQVLGYTELDVFLKLILKILLGALIAFFMEFTEVLVVTYTSSLTLAIAGIFKEVFILVLAVEMNGDIMSPLNVVGLFVCLCGISGHVIHKLSTAPQRGGGNRRSYDGTHHRDKYELGESLIEEIDVSHMSLSSDSEGEKSDTQILFDVLNRESRYST